MPKPIEPSSPDAETRAKWREEFKKMGPEQLRSWVNASGPPGSAAKRVQAAVWLREQERKSGDWQWWILFFVIVAGAIAVTGAVVTMGRMF